MAEVKKQKLSKKLPKRTGRRTNKRMGHKERAAQRHMNNKREQFAREVKNNAKRDLGLLTPWEEAKAKRAEHRKA